jgi:hypothetical protein
VPPGPGPGGVDLRARVDPGHRGPRCDARRISARTRAVRDVTVHLPPRVRTCGVELPGPGPGRDVTDRPCPDGGSPSPKATVYGPSGHNRCTPGFRPGLRRGRTRSDARFAASVFCAGVLSGSCVAPRSPWGPPPRRRELDPRGALRRGTDAGLMAGLNECPSIHSASAAAGALRRLESAGRLGASESLTRIACFVPRPDLQVHRAVGPPATVILGPLAPVTRNTVGQWPGIRRARWRREAVWPCTCVKGVVSAACALGPVGPCHGRGASRRPMFAVNVCMLQVKLALIAPVAACLP